MINLEINIDQKFLKETLSVIADSSDRPAYYSIAEDGKRFPIANAVGIIPIIGQSGCFLWGNKTVFDIRISAKQIAIIFVASEDADIIESLALGFSKLPLFFGYACDREERIHRNRISKKMNYGVEEAWVGRDYNRYLPGIYWITLVSNILMEHFGIGVEALKGVAKYYSTSDDKTWLIRLYQRPSEWEQKAHLIDNWCAKTVNCFSKERAEADLERAETFLDVSTVIGRWK